MARKQEALSQRNQVVTNSPDQQARRPLLQPSIGYALRHAPRRASGSAAARRPLIRNWLPDADWSKDHFYEIVEP
jgi:hypothetical protein